MRTITLTLLEPEDLVKGKVVFCTSNGEGKIINSPIDDDRSGGRYPIKVEFFTEEVDKIEEYTLEGKMYMTDNIPSLYSSFTANFPLEELTTKDIE